MDAVTELVRQCHHIARLALVVQQQIGVRARHRRVGKGARRLAGPQRRIDPPPGEKTPADRSHLGREGAVGRQHGLLRFRPGNRALLLFGQRCVAVPERQFLDPEPMRLQPVIAVRQSWIALAHRRDQRIDDLVLDKICQIARGDRSREAAPAVLDFLVLGERVGDQREGARVLAQHLADRLRRLAADFRVLVGQQIERFRLGQLLAAKREPQVGDRLVEQPRPGGSAGDIFLVQQLLDLVAELVRAERTRVAQPRPVTGEHRVAEFRVEVGVFEPVEFECEEQQRRRDRVRPLLHRLVESADFRIGKISGVHERGIAHDAADLFLEPLISLDRSAELGPGERSQAPLVAIAKRFGFLGECGKVACQLLAVGTGIKVR